MTGPRTTSALLSKAIVYAHVPTHASCSNKKGRK